MVEIKELKAAILGLRSSGHGYGTLCKELIGRLIDIYTVEENIAACDLWKK